MNLKQLETFVRVAELGSFSKAALVLETDLQRTLIGSPNQMAAVTAGMTREPGAFTDPAV